MRNTACLLLLVSLAACGDGSDPGERPGSEGMGMGGAMQHAAAGGVDTTGLRGLAVPAEHRRGLELYAASCAACHGEAALGTPVGPPLVHIVYEPNHHADAAFVLAAERGVRAHHWRFGDMPPQPGVSRDDLLEVIAYVRWLQREAGVY